MSNVSTRTSSGNVQSLLRQIRSDLTIQGQVASLLQDLGIDEDDSEVQEELSAIRPALAQLQNGQLKSGRYAKPHDAVKTLPSKNSGLKAINSWGNSGDHFRRNNRS